VTLRRDPITIVAYDEAWPEAFEQQRRRVEPALAPWLTAPVEHIGSTAVPGLPAKPIIDMLALIPNHDHDRAALVEAMSGIAWTHAPEPGDAKARKWSFCFPDIGRRTHHLHIFESTSDSWPTLLTFRDHLRNHPAKAAEYANLKATLAAADPQDRPRYRSGKAPFIEALLHQLATPGNQ
jgi:GrpB-like predicted nucleotidyltransferase (UPF0157 family)